MSKIRSFRYLDNLINSENRIIKLECDIEISDNELEDYMGGIPIRGIGDLVIDGNGHSIDAGGKARIFQIFQDDLVTIKNVTLRNGFAPESDDDLLPPKGGAIYSQNGRLNIVSSKFVNNRAIMFKSSGGAISAQGHIHIDDCIFQCNNYVGCEGKYAGGALDLSNASAKVNNSLFKNNHSDWGGAIINDSSVLSINECKFINNRAFRSGGAIYNKSGNIKIRDTLIEGNTEGAIVNYGNIKFQDCMLQNNMSKQRGGAIWTKKSEDIDLKSSIFAGNEPNDIYVDRQYLD